MYRIEWQLSDGARREHYCQSKDDAAGMFNNLLWVEGVVKVLAYERVDEPDKSRPEWRLLKMGTEANAS